MALALSDRLHPVTGDRQSEKVKYSALGGGDESYISFQPPECP
jgi:hypothetical protein